MTNKIAKYTILLLVVLFFTDCKDEKTIKPIKRSQSQYYDSIPCMLVYGDTRTFPDSHRMVVNAMLKHKFKAVIHTGDLVSNGLKDEQWKEFFEIVKPLTDKAPFYPVLGNHELNSPLYFQYFNLPGNERYYTVIVDSVCYLILDSNNYKDVDQIHFLEQQLTEARRKFPFVVVVFHQPPFSSVRKDKTRLDSLWVPILERHNIDLVLNGHNHSYERSYKSGISYIVAAGGGAPLYNRYTTNKYSVVYKKSFNFCRIYHRFNQLIVIVQDEKQKVIDKLVLCKKYILP